ncbi:MAG TPA: 50S ribosomal protein L18 [bacterium]|nr:50S ribosomal protein L18 [bacterium]
MIKHKDRNLNRQRRHLRIRRTVSGTPERPRLSVFRSLSHVYVQLVDDGTGRTLAAASTLDPEIRAQADAASKSEACKIVGQLIARRAKERGLSQVVFDRGGYQYHGRVRAVAEGAREGGLEF